MRYSDIIPTNNNATAEDVAELILNGELSNRKRINIYEKLWSDKDRKRLTAIDAAMKIVSKRNKKDLLVHEHEFEVSTNEFDIAECVRNRTQLKLALKYRDEILSQILHRFNDHFKNHGAKYKDVTMQKKLNELIRFCRETDNESYDSLKDISLSPSMSKTAYKKKVKKAMVSRFMQMGVENYMINKTNAERLVTAIFVGMKKYKEDATTDPTEIQIFDSHYNDPFWWDNS